MPEEKVKGLKQGLLAKQEMETDELVGYLLDARQDFVWGLEHCNPPLSEEMIQRETASYDEAVQRVLIEKSGAPEVTTEISPLKSPDISPDISPETGAEIRQEAREERGQEVGQETDQETDHEIGGGDNLDLEQLAADMPNPKHGPEEQGPEEPGPEEQGPEEQNQEAFDRDALSSLDLGEDLSGEASDSWSDDWNHSWPDNNSSPTPPPPTPIPSPDTDLDTGPESWPENKRNTDPDTWPDTLPDIMPDITHNSTEDKEEGEAGEGEDKEEGEIMADLTAYDSAPPDNEIGTDEIDKYVEGDDPSIGGFLGLIVDLMVLTIFILLPLLALVTPLLTPAMAWGELANIGLASGLVLIVIFFCSLFSRYRFRYPLYAAAVFFALSFGAHRVEKVRDFVETERYVLPLVAEQLVEGYFLLAEITQWPLKSGAVHLRPNELNYSREERRTAFEREMDAWLEL